jgi:hypothetical protein
MRGPHQSMRLTPCGVTVASCAAALLAAGCGSDSSYKNDPRPPSPIVITASVGPDAVSVSPKEFGAGPISLIVTNQTESAQRVTLKRDAVGEQPFEQQTSPINPHGTASLKADIAQGTYAVRVEGDGIKPAEIKVGPERESAQNDLLQP